MEVLAARATEALTARATEVLTAQATEAIERTACQYAGVAPMGPNPWGPARYATAYAVHEYLGHLARTGRRDPVRYLTRGAVSAAACRGGQRRRRGADVLGALVDDVRDSEDMLPEGFGARRREALDALDALAASRGRAAKLDAFFELMASDAWEDLHDEYEGGAASWRLWEVASHAAAHAHPGAYAHFDGSPPGAGDAESIREGNVWTGIICYLLRADGLVADAGRAYGVFGR
jgi:hypothetical protein